MKQVLTASNGYAKPMEIMAIMGASGSGKTSLLNVIAQRMSLCPGFHLDGEVRFNNRVVDNSDFGKIGAFVQQDDILIETMTPVESFTFAARLRTSLTEDEIPQRVMEIVDRLSLDSCKHTRIGGVTMKGISGGERKRTSIGYELITDPVVILLDEPTSGLDSSSALKIVTLLKKEASRGKTVIATIHQPSGKIFMQFDRLLLLQDGFQLYQGPLPEISGYLKAALGIVQLSTQRYFNMADFIIKMAQAP
jgi:ABC-type multidrug transport system ATPase subunit